MSTQYVDVVVVGLGAMGCAATYQLAKAGASVLGFDRFSPPHPYGSTHGDSRITRLGVGEGAEYVPLVRRSHEIWRELESETGEELLRQCGGLVMAGRDAHGLHGVSEFLTQTVDSAREYGIEHELLTTGQIARRFGVFSLRHEEVGYYEPTAGLLRPERAVAAQLRLARAHGAKLALDERVLGIEDSGSQVTVITSARRVVASTVIVAAGPWAGELLPDVVPTLRVHRQVMYWFDLANKDDYETYASLPIFIWEFGGVGRDQFIYGFPMIDGPTGGMKVATEDYTASTSPDEVEPVSDAEGLQMFDAYVADQLPGLMRRCVRTVSCLYTVAPQSRFVIDRHPRYRNVIVASPCSGHGFKHSAAIGEALAQLVTVGHSSVSIDAFGFPPLMAGT